MKLTLFSIWNEKDSNVSNMRYEVHIGQEKNNTKSQAIPKIKEKY